MVAANWVEDAWRRWHTALHDTTLHYAYSTYTDAYA